MNARDGRVVAAVFLAGSIALGLLFLPTNALWVDLLRVSPFAVALGTLWRFPRPTARGLLGTAIILNVLMALLLWVPPTSRLIGVATGQPPAVAAAWIASQALLFLPAIFAGFLLRRVRGEPAPASEG